MLNKLCAKMIFTLGHLILVLSILRFTPYVLSSVFGKTRPKRFTWFLFALLSLLLYINGFLHGEGESLYIVLGNLIGCSLIFVLSLKKGVGPVPNLIIWIVFSISLLYASINAYVSSTIFNLACISMSLIGFSGTFKKAYDDPQSEDKISWIFYFISSLLNLFTLNSFQFESILYPIYLFSTSVVMIYIIYISKNINLNSVKKILLFYKIR